MDTVLSLIDIFSSGGAGEFIVLSVLTTFGYLVYKTLLFDSLYKSLSRDIHSLKADIITIKNDTKQEIKGLRNDLHTINASLHKIIGKLESS